jgi:hypothetical protein
MSTVGDVPAAAFGHHTILSCQTVNKKRSGCWLREALSRLLRAECESASLIVELVVDGTDPAVVAAERGVSRPALVEQLRAAIEALATHYERLVNGDQ